MTSKHLLIHVIPSWGHHKPVTALAVLIVRARPDIVVTVLTTNVSYEKFMNELKFKLSHHEFDALITRIHVIDIGGPKVHPLAPLSEFGTAFAALCNGQSLTCNSSGTIFASLPRPKAVIVDHFAGYAYDAIFSISRKDIPIISLLTVPAGTIVRIFGPRKFGGTAPVEMETKEGRSIAKAKLNAMIQDIIQAPPPSQASIEPVSPPMVSGDPNSNEFEIVDMPGAPPIYSHEMNPQVPIPVVEVFRAMGQIYTPEADGAIDASVTAFDGEMMGALRSWLDPLGQPVYAMAPLALPILKGIKTTDTPVVNFLDKMSAQFGKRSLVYISFGTIFSPSEPEKLWAMINTLITTRTPFILTHASPRFQISEEEKLLIHNSGLGLALAWSPQEVILTHQVTGWFVTHAGWNSILEALAYKVPLILWPMSADQPINAATLTLIHKAAFELIGVRSGKDGTKPLLRFRDTGYTPSFTAEGVKQEFEKLLEKIKGEEGQLVRRNFETLSDKVGNSWDEGGESKRDLDSFLAKFIN